MPKLRIPARAIPIALAIACGPMTAVANVVMPIVVVGPGNVERPTTEIAPSGTVILRGGRPAPDVSKPTPERTSVGKPPLVASPPSGRFNRNYDNTGIDRTDFDTSGKDRNFDVNGFDRDFDRHGLTRP